MASWRSFQLDAEPKYGRPKKLPYKKQVSHSSRLDAIDEGPDIKEAPALRELSDKIDQEIRNLDANRQTTAKQIEKLFKKCHKTLSRLEKELLLDLDETCGEKEKNLRSQRAGIEQSLGKLRSLEGGSEIGPGTASREQDIYVSPSMVHTFEPSGDWSSSYNNGSSLSQSLRGHNLAARDAPKSGSNRMQPVECSFVDVRCNQVALLHMLDEAVEKYMKLCASEASPARTKVSIGKALVNHLTIVKVTTRYPDGDECEHGGEPLSAEFSCPDGTKIAGTVKDNNDGTYDVSFEPNSPGTHILSLSIQNTPIGHSPYEIYVSPVCPSKSTAKTSPCMVDYAGLTTVSTCDTDGNRCFFGGDDVAADLRDPHGSPLRCSIDDNNNGTYHVTYNPSIAGIHSMTIKIHGEDIENNPLEVPVRAISAKNTKIKIKRARLGKRSRVNVQAIDHNGQRLRHGGDLIRAQMYNERDQLLPCTVQDNQNGTYTIIYTPTEAGEYLLGVTIHRWSVGSETPYVVEVPEKESGVLQGFLDRWDDITDWLEDKLKRDPTLVPPFTYSWSHEHSLARSATEVIPPTPCCIF